MNASKPLTPYQQIVHDLSERLVRAQQPIRILDAIKWGPEVQAAFFASNCKQLPAVDANYYQTHNALNFDPQAKQAEFYDIENDIRRQLGIINPAGNIMQRMCREYRDCVRMLAARGTDEFNKISQELYGSSDDAFYAGAPRLSDLADLVSHSLVPLKENTNSDKDEKRYSSEQMMQILGERLGTYFGNDHLVKVKLNDGIVADASAGADCIKIRTGATFSERDLRVIEVHEGWVHVGTTINGLRQPICTFLSKGPPSSTITQEGLAIIMEIFTFASYPGRVRRLTDRITAIHMAEAGANFIEVFEHFTAQGFDAETSYTMTTRVFRGSTPTGKPFTKDLVYSKGFVMIYNYIRLAIQRGLGERIALLFAGKTTLEDQKVLADLLEEGLIESPRYVPPQFADLAALSAWMTYSLFLNKLDLECIAVNYKELLQN